MEDFVVYVGWIVEEALHGRRLHVAQGVNRVCETKSTEIVVTLS